MGFLYQLLMNKHHRGNFCQSITADSSDTRRRWIPVAHLCSRGETMICRLFYVWRQALRHYLSFLRWFSLLVVTEYLGSVAMASWTLSEPTTENIKPEQQGETSNDIAGSITIAVEALLMAIILVENGLIIFCFARNKKLWRNITNYYIMQLCLSDFVTGLFTGFHIAAQLHPTLLYNEIACLARYCSMMIVCSISLLSILLITYDRFVAIFRPFYYRSHVSKGRVLLKCLIIDVIPIIVCLIVPLFWRKELKGNCLMVNILPFEYLAFILIPMYLITIIFKFTMYGVIFYKMSKRLDRAKRMVQNRSSQSMEQLERISRGNIALTKTGGIVLVCFTLCWTPFFIHMIFQLAGAVSTAMANTISVATFMLILLNSALNPVIYVLRLPFFRKELKRALGCANTTEVQADLSFRAIFGGNPSDHGSFFPERCGIYFLHSHSLLHRGRMASHLRDHRRQSGETLISYRKRSDESIASYQFLWRQTSDRKRDILQAFTYPADNEFEPGVCEFKFDEKARSKRTSVETFLSTFWKVHLDFVMFIP